MQENNPQYDINESTTENLNNTEANDFYEPTLEEKLFIVNQHLSELYLPSISNETKEAVIEALYLLSSSKKESDKVADSLSLQNRRLTQELDETIKQKERTQEKYEYNLREINYLKGQINKKEKEIKSITKTIKDFKEETRLTNIKLQSTKSQFSHELKRKELESNKLKEKCLKLFSEKASGGNKLKITPINEIIIKSGTSNSIEKEKEVYFTTVIQKYIDREKRLVDYAKTLKQHLLMLYYNLRDFIIEEVKPQLPYVLKMELNINKKDVLSDIKASELSVEFGGKSEKITSEICNLTKMVRMVFELIINPTNYDEANNNHDFNFEDYRTEISMPESSTLNLHQNNGLYRMENVASPTNISNTNSVGYSHNHRQLENIPPVALEQELNDLNSQLEETRTNEQTLTAMSNRRKTILNDKISRIQNRKKEEVANRLSITDRIMLSNPNNSPYNNDSGSALLDTTTPPRTTNNSNTKRLSSVNISRSKLDRNLLLSRNNSKHFK